jgi:pyruvate/2-oxoglutarate dehydrogenase complex dihydrolipoamide dehydrogenase (E3) component
MWLNGSGKPRICVIGAGPSGLTTLKNILAGGLRDVVCFEESDAIGGNWVFREETNRMSVYEATHIISSKALSEFEDFPMPHDYPDFPSHRQVLAYFENYAEHFGLRPYIKFKTRVTQASLAADGKWLVQVEGPDGPAEEHFDYIMVAPGHHREPSIPSYPGRFTGQSLHSCAYRRADPFRGKDVLVVGAGNSACDIADDISRVARRTCISMRRPSYIVPKLIWGFPIDVFCTFFRFLPKPIVPALFRFLLRVHIGAYDWYGLQAPTANPLSMHPTLNTGVLEALRHGRVLPRIGIDRFEGEDVHFKDGRAERFDAVVFATGFRTCFPFLPASVIDWESGRRPPLYLKMMHRSLPSIFFIGLFQPLGCIWTLADYQARIAVAQITGKLKRPNDLKARIEHEVRSPHWQFDPAPRHAIEVDYHDFRQELLRELARSNDKLHRRHNHLANWLPNKSSIRRSSI